MLAVVLAVVGVVGFVVCILFALYEYYRPKRDPNFTRKLQQLEAGFSNTIESIYDSSLPDHLLRGEFEDSDRVVMRRRSIHGYSVLVGRWEDWFREADREYLSGRGSGKGVGKVALWMRLFTQSDPVENLDMIDDTNIREALKVTDRQSRVDKVTELVDSNETSTAAASRILYSIHSFTPSALSWFPPIFMLNPDWTLLSDTQAINVIITCPTCFLSSQNFIPTRFILSTIMVAVHDDSYYISAVIDHQLSTHFKSKFKDNKDKQLWFMSSKVVPFILERGWRTKIPIVVDLFTVWGPTLQAGMESVEDAQLYSWFTSNC